MGHQAKEMITIGVWGPLHPNAVEEVNRFPGQREGRLKRSQPTLKLMTKQRMIENALAERGALLGIGKCFGHGALRQRHTHHAVGYARKVQNFEDEINSRVRRAEQVAFAAFQLHFSSRNRAGGNLVLEPPNEIVELAILAVSRDQE